MKSGGEILPRIEPPVQSPWRQPLSARFYTPFNTEEDDVTPLPSCPASPPPEKKRPVVLGAGEELSFDDMFDDGEVQFEHRRSRSVISLDDIPEEHVIRHSIEKTASTLLKACTIDEEANVTSKLGPSDFDLLAVVGQGAFGKVFQVKKRDTATIYAMKVMKKETILQKDHAQYVWSERDCLTMLNHPYIVNLYYSFQTKHKLYMILEFLTGGHLFFQLYQKGCFTEEQTRFYTAELISAVSFLHSKGIIHRDLKPENVLLDSDGHIKVTDFGLSKGNMGSSDARAESFVGTIQYMAPEIIRGKDQTTAVDWWSIGVLIYEMISGEPPFDYPNKMRDISEKDRKKLMNRIASGKIKRPRRASVFGEWGLYGNTVERQKFGEEIRSHSFFKKIDWDAVERRHIASPFRPESKSHTGNIDKRFRNMPAVDSPCGTPDHPNVFQAFQGYSYSTPSALRKSGDRWECF